MANALVYSFDSRLARHRHVLWYAGPAAGGLHVPHPDATLVREYPLRIWSLGAPPRVGRYYPARLLPGPQSLPVFRVLAVDAQGFRADRNPPAAGLQGSLQALEDATLPAGMLDPARLLDWLGMEAPLPERDTDFGDPDAFDREDEEDDAAFYRVPRLLLHLDELCAARLRHAYGQLIPPGAGVLDLMSGWRSHLPAGCRVTGLGMNAGEMQDNPELADFRLQDLNREPVLPFADASFDAVVNSVSIEYLTRPDAVLAEVRRVLRPGGRLVIACSQRFFPTKAIALWRNLHPMERLGWVLQRLAASGFTGLQSLVERGLPRPAEDRHAAQLAEADPLFLAWGERPAADVTDGARHD